MWVPHGPYSVGFVDVEWEARPGTPPDEVAVGEHLSGRIFYPTPHKQPRWWNFGVPWLPHVNYATGLSRFLFFRRPVTAVTLVLRALVQALTVGLGWLQRMWLLPGAPLAPPADASGRPVVVFSHGLGGFRSMYTLPCAELASQGYVVLALEHLDGSSSAARAPGGAGGRGVMRYYAGLGGDAGQVDKTRQRCIEMRTGYDVLAAMARGVAPPMGEVRLSSGAAPTKFLAGQLDMAAAAAVGHSYGGATVTAFVSEDPCFKAGVAFDPWWFAMPPESPAMHAWQTDTPLLVLGSHSWNVPNAQGAKICGERRQQAVLDAACWAKSNGGAVLAIIKGTSHNTFADPLPLFGGLAGWALARLGLSAELDPVLGMDLVNTATLSFLAAHVPLGAGAAAEQNWAPAAGAALLAPHARPAHESQRPGLIARAFFQGRGPMVAVSDALIRHVIPPQKIVEKLRESPRARRDRHFGGKMAESPPADAGGEWLASQWSDEQGQGAEADGAGGPLEPVTSEELAASMAPTGHVNDAMPNGHESHLALGTSESRLTRSAREIEEVLGADHFYALEVHQHD